MSIVLSHNNATFEIVKIETGEIINIGDFHTWMVGPDTYRTEQIVGVNATTVFGKHEIVTGWFPQLIGLKVVQHLPVQPSATEPLKLGETNKVVSILDGKTDWKEVFAVEEREQPDFSEEDKEVEHAFTSYSDAVGDYNTALEKLQNAKNDMDDAASELASKVEDAASARRCAADDCHPSAIEELNARWEKIEQEYQKARIAYDGAINVAESNDDGWDSDALKRSAKAIERWAEQIDTCVDIGDEVSAVEWDDFEAAADITN